MFLKDKNFNYFLLRKLTIKDNYFNILVFFIVFFYFLNSILFSKNIFDSHTFWIFDEAMQLLRGNNPYKEIAIMYGIGTPLINALGLIVFGKNLFSIILINNIFFFSAIFFIFLICLKLKFNKINILILVLILININPVLHLPWSNYLAYFPIVLSLYFILDNKKTSYFFSGFFLALACLTREVLLLSATIIFFYVIFENTIKKKNFNILKFFVLGFLFPLVTFLIYMFASSNYLIWRELVYEWSKWQSLINVGYYIKEDVSPLRKFYIIFFAPYRELFLVFFKSIQHFWFNWLLIYLSYFFCTLIVLARVFKNSYWKEDELIKYKISIISVYCLSLIIQNLHSVNMDRVSTGSIIGIIILIYLVNKIIISLLVKFISYFLILILLFFYSHGIVSQLEEVGGRLNKLYSISYVNLKNSLVSLASNKEINIFDKKPFVTEFRNMNYDASTHKFYDNISKICNELTTKKGIQYSDNQTSRWELNYFCKTTPKYYYTATMSESLELNFKKSQLSKKSKSEISNTIQFYISDDLDLKETVYWDIRGFKKKRLIKNIHILYFVDLKKSYPSLYKHYNSRYFFITQSYKKAA